MKNYLITEEHAHTQYNDLQGIISIDGRDGPGSLLSLCEDKGIDMNKYFILSFSLSESTIRGIGLKDAVNCTVYLLEKKKYGKTFDEIRAKINSLESVDVIHKSFSMKYSELTKYIKRYNFMAITAMGDYIKKMNVIY